LPPSVHRNAECLTARRTAELRQRLSFFFSAGHTASDEAGWSDPSLDARAAPRGGNEADGHIKLAGEFAAEEITGGGEVSGGFGRARLPLRGKVEARLDRGVARNQEQTQLGIAGLGKFIGSREQRRERGAAQIL